MKFWLGVVIVIVGLVGVAGAVVGLIPADPYAYLAMGGGTLAGVILMIQNIDPRKRWRIRAFSILRLAFLLAIYGGSLGVSVIYYAVRELNKELPPDLGALLEWQPNRKSVVLSSDGEEIGNFSIENRRIIPLGRMPQHLIAAFLSAEDHRFYEHTGFDLVGIGRAAWLNFRADGDIKQGASTITQQIIKQTLLVGEEVIGAVQGVLPPDEIDKLRKAKKYRRKMKELILAVRLERELSKTEILEIYLNHIYLGHGAYGVAAAARTYFGKEVEDVTIGEAAMLAGLVRNPTKYAPHNNIHLAREYRDKTLQQMVDHKYISVAEFETSVAEPIVLVDQSDLNHLASPYFVEHIRKTATTRYGDRNLFRGGLKFYSTLDGRMQEAAEGALKRGLESLDRRLGFRGPVGSVKQAQRGAWTGGPAHPLTGQKQDDVTATSDQVLPDQTYGAMVVELPRTGVGITLDLGPMRLPLIADDAREVRSWRDDTTQKAVELGHLLPVRLSPDGKAAVLAQRPILQGAMVVMEIPSGRVVASVGGYDWVSSQFDRVTQAKRQVGSSIKPFVYAAAIEAGRTPVDHMHDGPYSVTTATGVWTPANFDDKYLGNVTLMTALAYSLNTISVQLAVQVGLDRIIEILRGFGITSDIPRHISISLGTPDLTPLEVATGYAGIAAGGRRVTPRFFDLVSDNTGKVVEDLRNQPPGPQVIPAEAAYVMTSLMKGAIERGTARYAGKLGRPTAGKTGTSANYRDVWFTGYTTDLLATVWVGRDDSTPIADSKRITGGGIAVPIWLEFMQKAHPQTPVSDFPIPDNISFARVEPWSGEPGSVYGDAIWMAFVRGTFPRNFLAAQPVRSFDDLVPAPVPYQPATRCASLSCL
ncbi:MAG: PBP1A family penicillin-binding protein [Deltaproteobacteria bacterium]|nr:PBP1A family penicillin-binding protein [Deltaproteobacteria bacterium]